MVLNIGIKNKIIEKIVIECLVFCQKFIRNIANVYSVSLRDARRFSIFYEEFREIMVNRKKAEYNHNESENDIKLKSVLFSLYICYILRISKSKDKDELYYRLTEIFRNNLKNEKNSYFYLWKTWLQ